MSTAVASSTVPATTPAPIPRAIPTTVRASVLREQVEDALNADSDPLSVGAVVVVSS